ncbi:hypothetical protein [Renibacterium salmoninarum]|nr:hypothetical protein [Renibacterium salmoninarum]
MSTVTETIQPMKAFSVKVGKVQDLGPHFKRITFPPRTCAISVLMLRARR